MRTMLFSLLAIAGASLLATSARAEPPRRWSPWSGESYTLPSSRVEAEYAEPRYNEGARHHQSVVYLIIQSGWTLTPRQDRSFSPSPHDDYFSFPYAR